VLHMFLCLEHEQDDPGARCPPVRARHVEVARGPRGMSLSDFIKRELARVAEKPTMQEWLGRTQQAKPIAAKVTAAKLVRALRDER